MRPGDVDAGLLTSSTWRSMWRRQAAAPGCAEVAGRHPRKRRAQSLLGPLAAHGALDLLMIGGMALRAGVGHTRHARPLPLATMRDPEG